MQKNSLQLGSVTGDGKVCQCSQT